MHLLCKILALLFILLLTGIESYVLINEFVVHLPVTHQALLSLKVVMATFIFNTTVFIFATKFRDAIIKIDKEENE